MEEVGVQYFDVYESRIMSDSSSASQSVFGQGYLLVRMASGTFSKGFDLSG